MKRLIAAVGMIVLMAPAVVAGPGAQDRAGEYVPKLAMSVPESSDAFGKLVAMGGSAVPSLIEGLGSHDELIRTMCAQALVDIGSPAHDAVIAALKHPEWRTRAWAALAIGEMRLPFAVDEVEQALLTDEHWWVRAQSAVTLGQIGTPEARFALHKAVNDADARVAQRASIMLQKIEG